jgi:hypothetical protein
MSAESSVLLAGPSSLPSKPKNKRKRSIVGKEKLKEKDEASLKKDRAARQWRVVNFNTGADFIALVDSDDDDEGKLGSSKGKERVNETTGSSEHVNGPERRSRSRSLERDDNRRKRREDRDRDKIRETDRERKGVSEMGSIEANFQYH